MAVTSERTNSRSALLALVVIGVLALAVATGDALEIVNKGSSAITVFLPPECQPCSCPMIYCIRAPCPQQCPCPCQSGQQCPPPDCLCPALCKLRPGVVLAAGSSVILEVDSNQFPLAFLSVVTKVGTVYNVAANDLATITQITTVVITGKPCEKDKKIGIAARVYPNPKYSGYKDICLLPGEKYGS